MKECTKCRNCYDDSQHNCPLDDTALTASITINLIISDRYILERRLGKGGMGIVFKAKHKFLKSSHAIKVILPNLVDDDDALLVRFKQEAVLAASIDHPNVIRVTDFGVEDGIMPYLVMEFVDGVSLSSFLVPGQKLPIEKAFEIFKPIARGVSEAHRHGIVHRDLKPQNIMIQNGLPMDKAVKVLDFGLAKIKSTEFFGSLIQAQTLSIIGSPPYMSPEQWENENVDHQADIYALGVLLYQMLTGRLPFQGDSIPAVMYQHLTAQPPNFVDLGVMISPAIEAVVFKSLQKKIEDRYETVEQMLADFENALKQPNVQTKTFADTQVMPLDMASTSQTIVESAGDSNPDSDSLSRTQKERLYNYFDPSEKEKVLADKQLAQEFLQAKDRAEEAQEQVSEADKLVQEFAEAQQYAQDAQQKAIEAKNKIEAEVRRRVETEMGDKMELEKQAQQKAEAERLATEVDARVTAEEEAQRLAQVALEAQQQAEAARKKAEEEIHQRELHQDVRIQAEKAAIQLAEQVTEAKRKYEEAQEKVNYETKLRIEAEAKRRRIEAELQAIAEHEVERRKLAEAEVQRLINEQSTRFEQDALTAQRAIDDAKRFAELESKKREQAEEAKNRAEEEARRLAEEIIKVQAHMEDIKQHTSLTTENKTVSFQDVYGILQPKVGDSLSLPPVSNPEEIQPTIDSFSSTIQQSDIQSVVQPAVDSSHNISQTTDEFQNLADSNQNISGLLNTNPIPPGNYTLLKVLIGAISLFFVIGIGSVGVYFLAFYDTGKPPDANNQNGKQGTNQPSDPDKPKGKERVSIAGGSFKMGRDDVPPTDPVWGIQYPAHTVSVTSFLIDKTEITNREYAEFVNETKRPSPSNWGGDKPAAEIENFPVAFVSFDDAKSYAEWISGKEKKECRLPTEQEWEYVARNGSQASTYPWGNEWKPEFANLATGKLAVVGTSNDETLTGGVKDLLGNVIEWTASTYSTYPGHPRALEKFTEELYVVRGSSWGEIKSNLKKSQWLLTNRQFVQIEQKSSYLGFRLVCKP